MRMFLIFILLSSTNLFSEEDEIIFNEPEESNVFFRDTNFKNENIKKAHFFFNFETTLLMYKNDNAYIGNFAKVEATDNMAYIGPSLGIGFRFPLISSFSTSSHLSVYQFINRDHQVDKASEEIPVIISEQENSNTLTGAEFAQRFFLRFEVTERSYFEPFFQIGLGYAQARSKYEHYYYDYLKSEYYSSIIKEELLTQNIALGFNIIHLNGIFMIFKIQKNVLTIGERESKVSQFALTANLGTPSTTSSTAKVNENRDEYSATLGFGYIF